MLTRRCELPFRKPLDAVSEVEQQKVFLINSSGHIQPDWAAQSIWSASCETIPGAATEPSLPLPTRHRLRDITKCTRWLYDNEGRSRQASPPIDLTTRNYHRFLCAPTRAEYPRAPGVVANPASKASSESGAHVVEDFEDRYGRCCGLISRGLLYIVEQYAGEYRQPWSATDVQEHRIESYSTKSFLHCRHMSTYSNTRSISKAV